MSTNRQCAYCGSQGQLTREHVFPKFIYSREGLEGDSLPVTAVIQKEREKFVQAELTIADVCTTCNGGFLSALDAYGAVLWDKFFAFIPQHGKAIRLEYDFHLLVRWLLKLAFNVGRSRSSQWRPFHFLEHLEQQIGYMRGGASGPANLHLYLQLIRPAELTPSQKRSLLDERGLDWSEVPPRYRRVGTFAMLGSGKSLKMRGYLVEMNAYVFYLVFWKPDLSSRQVHGSEREFLRRTLGAKRLYPDVSKSMLYLSSVNIVDFTKSDPLRLSHAIESFAWLSRKRKK